MAAAGVPHGTPGTESGVQADSSVARVLSCCFALLVDLAVTSVVTEIAYRG
jgi:hypothetical protein